MITLEQLETAYRIDPSSVERLAWWLDLNCIGSESPRAVFRKLWELEFEFVQVAPEGVCVI